MCGQPENRKLRDTEKEGLLGAQVRIRTQLGVLEAEERLEALEKKMGPPVTGLLCS